MTKHQKSIKLLFILLGIVIADFFLFLLLPQKLFDAGRAIFDFFGFYIISVIRSFVLFFTVLYFTYYYIRRTKMDLKSNTDILLYIAKLSAGAELIRLFPYCFFSWTNICRFLIFITPILMVVIYLFETILIFRKNFCSDICFKRIVKCSFFNYKALISLAFIIVLLVSISILPLFSDSARLMGKSLIPFFYYLYHIVKFFYILLLPSFIAVALTSVHLYLSLTQGFEDKRDSLL